MKKSLKLTSAAMAALLAVSCTSFSAFADPVESLAANNTVVETADGGWQANGGYVSMSNSSNANAKAAFKKATAGLKGVSYKPLAVLGTQVVAGTKYAILCKVTDTTADAEPQIKIMYILQDLKGNAKIIGFQTIIGEMLAGGFAANRGNFTPSKNKTAYLSYKRAMKEVTRVSYKPVAYLGSQVVAGSNYLMLCRSKDANASYQWSLVTINRDLKGNASVLDIDTLSLGKYDSKTEYDTPDLI